MHEITCKICLFTNFFLNHARVFLLLFLDLPKSQCDRCRETNFKLNDQAVLKNSVRYKSLRYIEGLL